ncbi:amidohydrolase family protein [Umezawaea sp. Da 62-37]|uniref:amidohydrolase family protein n=1 Tax=Umezawaea sp. Da 62-37 TaxID=3075927 RepID=UPI0028F6E19C|nr:amidohydrolase family protein [Umezawaea sp. Da 62-37]WNV81946.1 amidohydrolase family protein [Umezawaea sp. Da 62-37]
MIVDAHHHLWDLGVRDQGWITDPPMGVIRRSFSVGDLEPLAAAAGVSKTVVVQTVTEAGETPELLAVAEGSELVGAVVGWVDLTAPDVADVLAGLSGGHGGGWLRGIRHQVQGEPDPEWLCRGDVRRGLVEVGRAGLVYELLTVPGQLPAACRTVAALPDVRFVVDHCSKPPVASGELGEWAELIRSLAEYENVFCKVSGLVTEADWANWTVADLRPYFEVVLDAFGPERLMFGSDWPVCLLAAGYADVFGAVGELTGGLSEVERDAVFGGTAVGVYGL